MANDSDLAFSSVLDNINFFNNKPYCLTLTRHSQRNPTSRNLYFGQIIYSSGTISKVINTQTKFKKFAKKLANFITSYIA